MIVFSRRHPFLFFLLVLSGIIASAVIVVSLVTLYAIRSADFDGATQAEGDSVGVVEVTGVIAESKKVLAHLKRFREDGAIKAIVVRIDSPGGGIGPSQEIFREIKKTAEGKKVVASMGGVAASGGYYIAAGANKIIANPGTITGSIGVIMGFTNIQELLKKIGLTPVVIKSGQYKDMGSPVREMTPAEEQMLSDLADELHKQFIDDIAGSRGMDRQKVAAFADGRIFSGQTAETNGFVDRLGNLEDAIQWAGQLGGIDGEAHPVYARDRKLELLQYLFESSMGSILYRLLNPGITADYLAAPGAVGHSTGQPTDQAARR